MLFEKNQEMMVDLDFVLVHQLFHTSIEVECPRLSVMVGDIITVQNHLVKQWDKVGQGKKEDPIWKELQTIEMK